MSTALSTPTAVGLYINSLKKESSLTGSDPSPYTHLLGVDGYGNSFNSSGGAFNKLDQLFAWMQFYGYNYAILYDTSSGDFVSNGAASETFSSNGKLYLRSLIDKARTYGITDVAVVCDIFQPNLTTARYDGTSQIRKVHEYNTDGVTTVNQRIDWINIETEFWNFHYNTTPSTGATNYKFKANAGTSYQQAIVSTNGTDPLLCLPAPSIPTMNGGSPYIKRYSMVQIFDPSNTSGYEYRQVVDLLTSTTVMLDRPLPSSILNPTCGWFEMNAIDLDSAGDPIGTVDFKTYNIRLIACYQYILANQSTFLNSHGTRVQMEAYIGFPDYEANVGVNQLRTLATSLDRTLLTNYTRIPSWSYINGGYKNGPTNSHRVTDDLSYNNEKVHRLGHIISTESATANNAKCSGSNFAPPGYATDFNFSGYIMEGRSNAGALSGGTVNTCWPESSTRVAVHGTGAPGDPVYDTCSSSGATSYPGGLFPPPLNLTPKSITDIWEYSILDPGPVSSPAYSSPTYNELIATATTEATRVSNFINHDTIVVFDQEFIRQLTISPPLDLVVTIAGQGPTCHGGRDGSATVTVTGGQSPYTYLWNDPLAQTTVTAYGLVAGTYTVTVTDAVSTVGTATVTITDPPDITWTTTTVNTACTSTTGSITISGASGGPSSAYSYSVVPTGDAPSYGSQTAYTGLTSGSYDVYVYSGTIGKGCVKMTTVTLTTTSEPVQNITITNADCGDNGVIEVVGASGTPAYTYELYTVAMTLITSNSTGIFTGLAGGTYKLRTVDANGCHSSIATRLISSPGPYTGSVTSTDTSCFGGCDGILTFSYSGNYTPTEFIYNGVSSAVNPITGLCAGAYVTSMLDATGCPVDTGIVIIESQLPVAVAYTVTGITPDGNGSDGSIVQQSIYGTAPFSYWWYDTTGNIFGVTDPSLYNLPRGTYTVEITDANGCGVTQTFVLDYECAEFDQIEFDAQVEKAKCCYADMSELINIYLSTGDRKRLKCLLPKFRLLHILIKRLESLVVQVGNSNLGCDGVAILLQLINELCNCRDCKSINRH